MQELLKAIAHFQLPDIVTITQTMTDTQRKKCLAPTKRNGSL